MYFLRDLFEGKFFTPFVISTTPSSMGIFPIFLSFVVFPYTFHLEKSYPFFTKVGGGSYDIKEYNVNSSYL